MLTNRIIAALTLLLAAVYLYATTKIPTLEIGDPLGPKAFPILLGIGWIRAASLLCVETLKKEEAPAAKPPDEGRRHLWMIGGVTAWTALYFGVFERVGYLVATAVYLIVLMAIFNKNKWLANGLTSVLFAVGSYVLFVKILGVTLPVGILRF